jgi:hypothetical protein
MNATIRFPISLGLNDIIIFRTDTWINEQAHVVLLFPILMLVV